MVCECCFIYSFVADKDINRATFTYHPQRTHTQRRSTSSISTLQHPLLASSSGKTVDSPNKSMHSFIFGMEYEPHWFTTIILLLYTQKRMVPLFFAVTTIVVARLVGAGSITSCWNILVILTRSLSFVPPFKVPIV